ncbi:peptide deformylase [Angustibacter sp. McL0619]|uniref:peptide deformylase n=1 Tax=Angustibacter sp. McL0619 TaxID=3415676 RepID=UPI003CF399B7
MSGPRPLPSAAPIRQVGDPVLRTPTAAVLEFDDDLRALVDRMWVSMHAARGVGLAANQIGVGLSVFVFEVDDESGVVVNPTLVETSGGVIVEEEGCLSVVGQVFETARHEFAVVTGFDVEGNPVQVRGEGLLARCLQHETDHLNGLLYLDRLSGRDRRAAIKEAAARESREATRGAFGTF